MKKYCRRGLIVVALIFMLCALATSLDAMGRRPHSHGPRPSPPPIGMAEASTLGLLGVGIAGVAAYFIAKRRKKK
jgi:LPXTG-motif cell wall-anchored protein